MVVEIRIYKRFDTDLVALADAGYSVGVMIKEAVTGYATGNPVYFLLDELTPFDINGKNTVHTRFTISEYDTQTCFLLRNIKRGYRNSFCKSLLRNALIFQNVGIYFSNPALFQLHANNMRMHNVAAFKNTKLCSEYRGVKQVTFLNHTVTSDNTQSMPVNMTPPYGGANYGTYPMGIIQNAPINMPPKKNSRKKTESSSFSNMGGQFSYAPDYMSPDSIPLAYQSMPQASLPAHANPSIEHVPVNDVYPNNSEILLSANTDKHVPKERSEQFNSSAALSDTTASTDPDIELQMADDDELLNKFVDMI